MDVGELLSFKVSIFLFYIFLSWIENACYYYLVPKVLEQRPAKIPTLHIPALSYMIQVLLESSVRLAIAF